MFLCVSRDACECLCTCVCSGVSQYDCGAAENSRVEVRMPYLLEEEWVCEVCACMGHGRVWTVCACVYGEESGGNQDSHTESTHVKPAHSSTKLASSTHSFHSEPNQERLTHEVQSSDKIPRLSKPHLPGPPATGGPAGHLRRFQKGEAMHGPWPH